MYEAKAVTTRLWDSLIIIHKIKSVYKQFQQTSTHDSSHKTEPRIPESTDGEMIVGTTGGVIDQDEEQVHLPLSKWR